MNIIPPLQQMIVSFLNIDKKENSNVWTFFSLMQVPLPARISVSVSFFHQFLFGKLEKQTSFKPSRPILNETLKQLCEYGKVGPLVAFMQQFSFPFPNMEPALSIASKKGNLNIIGCLLQRDKQLLPGTPCGRESEIRVSFLFGSRWSRHFFGRGSEND